MSTTSRSSPSLPRAMNTWLAMKSSRGTILEIHNRAPIRYESRGLHRDIASPCFLNAVLSMLLYMFRFQKSLLAHFLESPQLFLGDLALPLTAVAI